LSKLNCLSKDSGRPIWDGLIEHSSIDVGIIHDYLSIVLGIDRRQIQLLEYLTKFDQAL
jgi:hypothetical protein